MLGHEHGNLPAPRMGHVEDACIGWIQFFRNREVLTSNFGWCSKLVFLWRIPHEVRSFSICNGSQGLLRAPFSKNLLPDFV